jgi:YHS domain-containing protein
MQFGTSRRKGVAILALALVSMTVLTGFQKPPADPINKAPNGVALKGYDAVAYFQDGKAVKGSQEFQYEWMGAPWYFASAANRDRFANTPEKFAPHYGGYCAYAASRGYIYDADPEVWKIVEGKLYLNYNQAAQKAWEQDIPGNIKKGDQNWPRLIK